MARQKTGSWLTPARIEAMHEQIFTSLPSLIRQRRRAIIVDRWTTGTQFDLDVDDPHSNHALGRPFIPNNGGLRGSQPTGDGEYLDIATRAPLPIGKLLVSSLSQTVFWEGASLAGRTSDETPECVRILRGSDWARRQQSLNRAVIGHGLAFAIVQPGRNAFTGKADPIVRARSAKRMAIFFNDEGNDEWPAFALDIRNAYTGGTKDAPEVHRIIHYIDETGTYAFDLRGDINTFTGEGEEFERKDLTFSAPVDSWDLPFPPVVPFYNILDLEGNATGEIEPVMPLLRAIDQDHFDRLIVQRFGAWKIRYIAGLAKPDSQSAEEAQKIALRLTDLLVSEDPTTKFGAIDGTPTDGYIAATDHDLRMLSAVAQVPPHHLLGLSSNLQAEALAAAEAGLQRKSLDFRLTNNGSYEKLLRLIAYMSGNYEEASVDEISSRWRDTESRSFAQAVQALGMMAQQLQIPVEMLWQRLPNWDEHDTERAKELIESGAVERIMEALAGAGAGGQQQSGAQEQESSSGDGE